MKHILLLTGPVLFLLAELIAPGGSPDPAQRQAIIANNQAAWALSHQLFILAFAGLIWWLVRLWATLTRAPLLAGLGIVVSGFALLADFGIATLQLLALDAVRTLSPDQALAVITLTSSSQNLLLFVFLPYLGFAIGFVLLAWAILSTTGAGTQCRAAGALWHPADHRRHHRQQVHLYHRRAHAAGLYTALGMG